MDGQKNTKISDLLFEVCSGCGENKYFELEAFGEIKILPDICSCERKVIERREQKERNKQLQIRLNKLRKYSMMDDHFKDCRFENFEVDIYNKNLYEIAVNYCNQWDEMKKNGVGFTLFGKPGVGKSFSAFCIANRLIDSYVPVIAISSLGVLSKIKESYNSYGKEAEVDILIALRNASLLILDDIGAENDTPWAKEKLYEIINNRCRDGKPMICTTNLSPRQLNAKLTGDDGVARAYDRLIEMCPPVELTGASRRMHGANQKMKFLKGLVGTERYSRE